MIIMPMTNILSTSSQLNNLPYFVQLKKDFYSANLEKDRLYIATRIKQSEGSKYVFVYIKETNSWHEISCFVILLTISVN